MAMTAMMSKMIDAHNNDDECCLLFGGDLCFLSLLFIAFLHSL